MERFDGFDEAVLGVEVVFIITIVFTGNWILGFIIRVKQSRGAFVPIWSRYFGEFSFVQKQNRREMAFGKNCSSKVKRSGFNAFNVDAIDEGLGFVHCTRAMGRKRILVPNCVETMSPGSHFRTPSKRRLAMRTNKNSEKSVFDALPQDILVRILCFVDHDDLKQLIQVSKSIRDATLEAKQRHFAYSTPRAKRISSSRALSCDLDDLKLDSPEAPNAPKQQRRSRSQISRKTLFDISVALFHSPEDERGSRCINGGRAL